MVEPEVTINNQWSDRYTVIEVSGLDRPGLLYQLTTAISKLNLNIASAHVATFGERARDVFYVTDLLGAQITAPTRQAAIKSALIHLLSSEDNVRAGWPPSNILPQVMFWPKVFPPAAVLNLFNFQSYFFTDRVRVAAVFVQLHMPRRCSSGGTGGDSAPLSTF